MGWHRETLNSHRLAVRGCGRRMSWGIAHRLAAARHKAVEVARVQWDEKNIRLYGLGSSSSMNTNQALVETCWTNSAIRGSLSQWVSLVYAMARVHTLLFGEFLSSFERKKVSFDKFRILKVHILFLGWLISSIERKKMTFDKAWTLKECNHTASTTSFSSFNWRKFCRFPGGWH